jgi:LPXTG-motif cell wall-anchored protein
MARGSKWVLLAVASCALILLSGAAAAQETKKTTELRHFEIISVDGNKVVFRGDRGVREITLPDDFKLQMDGKEIGVADLKPGMKGTAVVTTTTTTKPVTVTEVRNAEVMAVAGNAVIVRGQNGLRKFTLEDVADRNISIVREGQKVELSQLRPSDKLTATIITRHPPQTVTEQEIKASVSAPAPAPAAAAPAPAAEPAPAAAPANELPKTGSNLPLLAWLGSLSLATGLGLAGLRRIRAAR